MDQLEQQKKNETAMIASYSRILKEVKDPAVASQLASAAELTAIRTEVTKVGNQIQQLHNLILAQGNKR